MYFHHFKATKKGKKGKGTYKYICCTHLLHVAGCCTWMIIFCLDDLLINTCLSSLLIFSSYRTAGPALTDFDTFLNIMAKRLTVPESEDQLIDAFKVFDKEGKLGWFKHFFLMDLKCSVKRASLICFRNFKILFYGFKVLKGKFNFF